MRCNFKTEILISFVFGVFPLFSISQNYLMLKDRFADKHEVLYIGKKIKVVTEYNYKINGVLSDIKDSSIVIGNFKETSEIFIDDIRFIRIKKNNGWKTAGGIILGVMSAEMTMFVYHGIKEAIKIKKNPPIGMVYDNPVPGLAVVGIIALPGLYTGTYFGLIHKKKYDLRYKYDVKVVKM